MIAKHSPVPFVMPEHSRIYDDLRAMMAAGMSPEELAERLVIAIMAIKRDLIEQQQAAIESRLIKQAKQRIESWILPPAGVSTR